MKGGLVYMKEFEGNGVRYTKWNENTAPLSVPEIIPSIPLIDLEDWLSRLN